MNFDFDIIVIGAGHAGCEAALAGTRLGCRVLVITHDTEKIAAMSCNPAIGGLGKGHLVKEIDALGGIMGLAADRTGIQFRLLNRSKGPAVRGTRSQTDMQKYAQFLKTVLESSPGITLHKGEVTKIENLNAGFLLKIDEGKEVSSSCVVVTAGTFIGGLLHTGMQSRPGGRLGDPASYLMKESLVELGIKFGRLKTGTCPRLNGDTIDFNGLERQEGDDPPPMFSYLSTGPMLPQIPCHITYTNATTHAVIRKGLDRSPLFCGIIKGKGPRYCPSIEDKIVRFPERERHQIFIEPEGLDTNEYYPNGISTSLPSDIQLEFVRSIKGLEHAEILKYGYAVEYDFVYPTQLTPTLMVKAVPGLFFAGQVNGTSGYEEAAGQGLIAGVNAALFLQKREPLILKREEAYIGVMIDDLVTKGTTEPYRMFTSRVEHRMLLREDNADARLTPLGRQIGLVPDNRWQIFNEKSRRVESALKVLKTIRFKTGEDSLTALEMLRRPGVTYSNLVALGEQLPELARYESEVVETIVKFQGYIDRERQRLAKIDKMSERKIPSSLDYTKVPGLSREVAERLGEVRPLTIGQASRIPGVTPAAISMLVIHLQLKV